PAAVLDHLQPPLKRDAVFLPQPQRYKQPAESIHPVVVVSVAVVFGTRCWFRHIRPPPKTPAYTSGRSICRRSLPAPRSARQPECAGRSARSGGLFSLL